MHIPQWESAGPAVQGWFFKFRGDPINAAAVSREAALHLRSGPIELLHRRASIGSLPVRSTFPHWTTCALFSLSFSKSIDTYTALQASLSFPIMRRRCPFPRQGSQNLSNFFDYTKFEFHLRPANFRVTIARITTPGQWTSWAIKREGSNLHTSEWIRECP